MIKAPSLPRTWFAALLCAWLTTACGQSEEPTNPSTVAAAAAEPAAVETEPEPSRPTQQEIQEELGMPAVSKAWTGDLDQMAERRLIRVLTVYGMPRYFFDDNQERGMVYELFKSFEDHVNEELGRSLANRIYVLIVPVARHELLTGLRAGLGDLASAGLTITPERTALVDFSRPMTEPLNEVLITGPSAEPVGTLQDLAGKVIHLRASSSYWSSLEAVNEDFTAAGLEPMELQAVSEYLEDADLAEMVHSGLLPWAVVDDNKAGILATVFDGITVRDDLVFRSGGRLGIAMRQESPQLKTMLDDFLADYRQGTLHGNILLNRYVRDFDWAENALGQKELGRFLEVREIFETYGERYGVDYLMAVAQGYQESRLDQTARSHTGALGIMQLLPSTAADANVGIPDISTADSNIHAGVKYLSFIRDRYFSDPAIDELDQLFLALAAYNAGPARIAQLRSKATAEGLDANVWFNNVEIIAAREIGRETVQYVSNIAKYYIAYRLSAVRELQRADAIEAARGEG